MIGIYFLTVMVVVASIFNIHFNSIFVCSKFHCYINLYMLKALCRKKKEFRVVLRFTFEIFNELKMKFV